MTCRKKILRKSAVMGMPPVLGQGYARLQQRVLCLNIACNGMETVMTTCMLWCRSRKKHHLPIKRLPLAHDAALPTRRHKRSPTRLALICLLNTAQKPLATTSHRQRATIGWMTGRRRFFLHLHLSTVDLSTRRNSSVFLSANLLFFV